MHVRVCVNFSMGGHWSYLRKVGMGQSIQAGEVAGAKPGQSHRLVKP